MMAGRSEKYETKNQADEFKGLSDRLAVDLRKSIQSLAMHPLLTPQWCAVAEVFSRIGKVTDMEAALPKTSQQSTLWECEEVALRYILEDGKLNLCLRLLSSYKEQERDLLKDGGYDELSQESKELLARFEFGAGMVMKNAWHHTEAMQITDLHVLLNHVADVLQYLLDNPGRLKVIREGSPQLELRQEILVFHYMYLVFKHMDETNDSRVLNVVKGRDLLGLAAKAILMLNDAMRRDDKVVAAKALALLVECEDFQTYKDDYMGPGVADALQKLQKNVLSELSRSSDARRAIRPLLDCIHELPESDV